MLNERKIARPQEELRQQLFVKRYRLLLFWAMRLTKNNRADAEDLVQDAFIQFTRGNVDLDAILNLDGYLRRTLQYLYLARTTNRTAQFQKETLPITDYDTLTLGMRSFDTDRHLQAQEDLLEICKYACIRKETSRAGSVLILRFFHEYSPTEIAKLLGRPRHCVDEWQRLARREARLYLENPRQLSFARSKGVAEITLPDIPLVRGNLNLTLRRMIFASNLGPCVSPEVLDTIYSAQIQDNLTTRTLAHIATCWSCLEAANQILGLPSLYERYDGDDDDSHRGSNSGNGSGASPHEIQRLKKRLSQTVDHEPQELQINVNGVLFSSVRVAEGQCELVLNLGPTNALRLIEIKSEQDITLLLLVSTAKSLVEVSSINLSEGRRLEARLSGAKLLVAYRIAKLNERHDTRALKLVQQNQSLKPDSFLSPLVGFAGCLYRSVRRSSDAFLSRSWELSFDMIWSPRLLALLFSLLVFLSSFIRTETPVARTAESLINEAITLQRKSSTIGDTVTHHVITLEEYQPGQQSLISRKTIEIWDNPTLARRADRIFDQTDQLLMERVQTGNGVAPMLNHPKYTAESNGPHKSLFNADEILQLLPTPQNFVSIVGGTSQLTVEKRTHSYVISYSGNREIKMGMLLKATLILSTSELRVIEQTIVVKRDGEVRDYRFIETRFDQVPLKDVDPKLFDPFLKKANPPLSKYGGLASHESPVSANTNLATADLEIQVAYLLDAAKADRNEQILLTRDSDRRLRIEGVLETKARKDELLHALGPVSTNPAVIINLHSAEEVTAATPLRDLKSTQTSIYTDKIPLDAELREFLSHSDPKAAQRELSSLVNTLASQVVRRAARASFQSVELRQLISRLSPTDLSTLSPDAREKLLSMLHTHANLFIREYSLLRTDLQNILHPKSSFATTESMSISNDRELVLATQTLETLSRRNDEAIRSAFMISAESSSEVIRSNQFWMDFAKAEEIARQITRYVD